MAEVEEADGDVRSDDSLEFLFDSNYDKSTYYHLVVNTAGTLYDGLKEDTAWSSRAEVAAGRGDRSLQPFLRLP